MRFLRSPLGALALLLSLAATVLLFAGLASLHATTAPPRHGVGSIDFESMMIDVEQVEFQATDGVGLRAWVLRGNPGRHAVILCHEVGSSKSSLINLALVLRDAGFSVLLLDFRGHGESEDRRSTLGLHEKRDIVGAVDYLSRLEGIDTRGIGIYGVGMGAHAAVLAAADRPSLKVLVLDGLYPDVSYRLVRSVYGDWSFGADKLALLPRGMFFLMHRVDADSQRASDTIERLVGRDLLLLAPQRDSGLAGEMRRMYETIPEQVDVDGNLVLLPATQGDGLYGDELLSYHQRVTAFLRSRLPPDS